MGQPRQTRLILWQHRRQRRSSAEGTLQRRSSTGLLSLNGVRGPGNRLRPSEGAHRRDRRAAKPTTTTPVGWARAMDTPLPVGQSRSLQPPRRACGKRPIVVILAEAASRTRAASARHFHHCHRRRPDHPRSGGDCPSRRWSTASRRAPLEGVSMAYSLADAQAPEDNRKRQYFEMLGNRGRLSTTAGSRPAATGIALPWDFHAELPTPSTRTCGSSTTWTTDCTRGHTTSRRRCPQELHELQRPLLDRAGPSADVVAARRP